MSIDNKKFTVAGTSCLNGQSKVRFANNLTTRVKTLVKAGHTNLQLIELPNPMTKIEAVEYLQSTGIGINPDIDLSAVSIKQTAVTVVNATVGKKAALTTGSKTKSPAKSAVSTRKPVEATA